MDWLSANHILLDCGRKKLIFAGLEGMQVISAQQFERVIQEGAKNFMLLACSIVTNKVKKEMFVVQEFMDVFPDEIPRLPPKREIEFVIDLIPGADSVSISPYRMAAIELVELKKQLEDLLEKQFIRPSVSPWGAPMLLVKKKDGSSSLCIYIKDMSSLHREYQYILLKWERPKRVTEIKSFVGKDHPLAWNEQCENSFEELKRRLTNAPVLTIPSTNQSFEVFCDASYHGLSCVLMQNKKIVAYASRQLKKSKIEHQRPGGMLIQLDIPVWKWDSISMDFVTHLPRTLRKHDYVWVIVDKLTKTTHFLPIDLRISMQKLTQIYIDEIVRLHGLPSNIVSDRDPRFTSRFWKTLQEVLGTKFRLSSAYHPQTDGQSERTIQYLEDFLRTCVLDHLGSWDEILPLVEFTYNNSYQASIRMAPFEALYGRK
ncbi:uncharacterized protein [Phaseolus vulgaris]|uniref:uncharacterized protein n=1 Tax=Phaseolus vulgaris TaxID=3885 RepID=UPI0035CBE660